MFAAKLKKNYLWQDSFSPNNVYNNPISKI